ncbi:MAG TPA: thiamine phosphate synthase [Lacipirellula sp.]
MPHDRTTLRILDAALNRASEGLRVVEDYVRFALDDGHLTELLKQLRHDLGAAGATLPWSDRHLARDTQQDVGTEVTTSSEAQRADAWGVCVASLERLKQSLRSLEEYAKVETPQLAASFEAIRYRLYTIEAAIGRTMDACERLSEARLYVLIDGRQSESEFVRLVESLLAGCVDSIQLRDKKLTERELVARARLLVELARRAAPSSPDLARSGLAPEGAAKRRPLVIINDRPDIAAIVDADGVHLGQHDMSVKDARAIGGPRKLIGVSTHSLQQARAAVLDGANYIGVGPTFPSRTKGFDAFPGVRLLEQVSAEIRLPAFAIGGITPDNVGQVVAAGFSRVAVSSALIDADDPSEAAAALRSALDSK